MRRIGSALACVLGFASAVAATPGTATAAPVTTFSAAGTAVELAPLELDGNPGPCAVALAASSTPAGAVGSGTSPRRVDAARRLRRARAPVARVAQVRRRPGDGRGWTAASSSPRDRIRRSRRATATGDRDRRREGADDPADRAVRGHVRRAALGRRKRPACRRDDRADRGRNRDPLQREGTAVDVSGDAALYGDCAVAVSGTHLLTADALVANGGTFTTVFGQGRRGHDTGTCLGGVGDFGYVLDRLETDGEEIATAHLRVAPSGTGPASGMTGSLRSTRRTRSCGSRFAARRQFSDPDAESRRAQSRRARALRSRPIRSARRPEIARAQLEL